MQESNVLQQKLFYFTRADNGYVFSGNTVNASPITPVSDDPNDLEALTANHFSRGPRIIAQQLFPEASRYVDYRKMYKVAQNYSAMIWQRWFEEYLPPYNAMCWPSGIKQQSSPRKFEIYFN